MISIKDMQVKFTVVFVIIICFVVSGCSQSSGLSNSLPTVAPSSSYGDSSSESDNSTTWNKTAGTTSGNDWVKMTVAQKESITKGVVAAWKNGGATLDVDYSWFIKALNSFYGSKATNATFVNAAMSLAGISGGVLHMDSEKSSSKDDSSSYDYSNDDSSSYDSSSSSSGGGEFLCMGKGDTCPNYTSTANDFYCDSCDPDGDNVEG